MNHYNYLDKYWHKFAESVGGDISWTGGIVGAHGDKGEGYSIRWRNVGIHFYHGMMIFLLSYIKPFSNEVRQTKNGFVNVGDWVIEKYKTLKDFLPPIEE